MHFNSDIVGSDWEKDPAVQNVKRCYMTYLLAIMKDHNKMALLNTPMLIAIRNFLVKKDQYLSITEKEKGKGGASKEDQAKVANLQFRKKFVLYSGHDTNFMVMLSALGFLKRECVV